MASVGTAGNLLTLLSIPWAQTNQILGFERKPFKYTTVFIINLAFADFLYCVTNLPMYSLTVGWSRVFKLIILSQSQYLNMGWPNGDDWTCRGFAAFRNMNAFAAWMALGLVAFSRWGVLLVIFQNRTEPV